MDKPVFDTLVALANHRKLSASALLAVCEVESGGKYFAEVDGREEPLIRFEGHYFYRLLGTAKRNVAVTRGLAHRGAGKIKNPFMQKARWRLLERASAIDRDCALQSTSWGIGQVMGVHWKWLNYASIDALVSEARSGIEGQAELMLRFIEKTGLDQKMEQCDWRGFARGYNGPAYASNRYDVKLERAHRKFCQLLGMPPALRKKSLRHRPLLLKFGDRGAVIADLQTKLRKAGYPLTADGDFGPATLRALRNFQREHGLDPDGIAGPATFFTLKRVGRGILPG